MNYNVGVEESYICCCPNIPKNHSSKQWMGQKTSFLWVYHKMHWVLFPLHKKWSFPLRISSVNVTKSVVSSIYKALHTGCCSSPRSVFGMLSCSFNEDALVVSSSWNDFNASEIFFYNWRCIKHELYPKESLLHLNQPKGLLKAWGLLDNFFWCDLLIALDKAIRFCRM